MGRKFAGGASLLMLLALLGLQAGLAGSATSPGRLTSLCQLSGVTQRARCGTLSPLENPQRADGRRLAIHFAIVPASSGKALSDPIVVLMGGPGEMGSGRKRARFLPSRGRVEMPGRAGKNADLTRYTFPYFASDLEQVRRALGYGQLNLFAESGFWPLLLDHVQ